MKKIALLLALLLLLNCVFVLGSCNKNNSKETSTETTSEPPSEELTEDETNEVSISYILNKNTKKFHYTDCYAVDMMDEENKIRFTGNRSDVINKGYEPCLKCNP